MTAREFVLLARRAFAAEDALRALPDTATAAEARATIREYVVTRRALADAVQLAHLRRTLGAELEPSQQFVRDGVDTTP